jgi:hypothetical protein
LELEEEPRGSPAVDVVSGGPRVAVDLAPLWD